MTDYQGFEMTFDSEEGVVNIIHIYIFKIGDENK